MTRAGFIYLASLAAHGALAVGIVSLRDGRKFEDVAISLVETKKKPEPAKVEPPPPAPEPELPKEQPKAKAAAPKPAPVQEALAPEPVAAAAEGAHDFGLSLGGASGPGGLAVRAGGPAPATSTTAAPPPVRKVLLAAPAADACDEPLKKPKPIAISQPAYTTEARTANIAGKVRVELTVDASGHVTSARVLEGLGYGLDEAALAAARSATFEPGTKCGKPTTATFTIAMRFTL